jgi:hypothetical protein
VGSVSNLDVVAKRRNPCWELNSGSLLHNIVTLLTELPQFIPSGTTVTQHTLYIKHNNITAG